MMSRDKVTRGDCHVTSHLVTPANRRAENVTQRDNPLRDVTLSRPADAHHLSIAQHIATRSGPSACMCNAGDTEPKLSLA